MGDLRPSSTRRLDLRSASDARGTKAVFTAHENAPAGLHEREAKGDVCCLRHRYELVRNIYKLKPPPVRCMTFSWSRAIRPRRQASGCLSARCTCGEAVRSPDERTSEARSFAKQSRKRVRANPEGAARGRALTLLPIPTPLRALRSLRLNPLKEDRQREVVCAKFAHTIATLGINLQNLQIIQNSH